MWLLTLTAIFSNTDIANYLDANIPHSTKINLSKVLLDLEKESNILFKCFTKNFLKANLEKSHLHMNITQEIQINVSGMAIASSKCEKLLGIKIDNKLTFGFHVRGPCVAYALTVQPYQIVRLSR